MVLLYIAESQIGSFAEEFTENRHYAQNARRVFVQTDKCQLLANQNLPRQFELFQLLCGMSILLVHCLDKERNQLL